MIKDKFEKFLIEQSKKSDGDFERVIEKNGFCSSLFDNGSKDCITYKTQKVFSMMYLTDIKKLLRLAERHGIEILFLKGIFMAADVYENISDRRFGDLDIMVKAQDVYVVKDILSEIGYYYQGCEDLMKQAKANHLTFMRNVTSQFFLMVEVHINICNPPHLYRRFTEIAWQNSGRQRLLDLEPLLLSPQDRILHSCIHFLNHCSVDPLYKLMNLNMPFRLQSVYDIALLIEKYGLDQEYLLSTSREIHAEFDLYYALSLIAKIVPELVPEDMLLKLKETSMSSEVVLLDWLKDILIDELASGQEVFDDSRPEKWLELLPFEEHNTLKVQESEQDFFSFSNEDFEMKGMLSCTNDVVFQITWRKKTDIPLNYELVAHGYQKGRSDIPCIKKYSIRIEDDSVEEVKIMKPFEGLEVTDIRTEAIRHNDIVEMVFYIPRYYFQNTVFLSMNMIYENLLEKQDICVTGKNWIDVSTMKSFVVV